MNTYAKLLDPGLHTYSKMKEIVCPLQTRSQRRNCENTLDRTLYGGCHGAFPGRLRRRHFLRRDF